MACPRVSRQTLLALALFAPLPALAATDTLPAPVADVAQTLALSDLDYRPNAKGPDLTGRLPSGAVLELDFHDRGRPDLEEIETARRSFVPLAEVAALLPAGIVGAEVLGDGATFEQIEFDDHEIEIEGRDATGRRFKAEFALDGQLLELKRD